MNSTEESRAVTQCRCSRGLIGDNKDAFNQIKTYKYYKIPREYNECWSATSCVTCWTSDPANEAWVGSDHGSTTRVPEAPTVNMCHVEVLTFSRVQTAEVAAALSTKIPLLVPLTPTGIFRGPMTATACKRGPEPASILQYRQCGPLLRRRNPSFPGCRTGQHSWSFIKDGAAERDLYSHFQHTTKWHHCSCSEEVQPTLPVHTTAGGSGSTSRTVSHKPGSPTTCIQSQTSHRGHHGHNLWVSPWEKSTNAHGRRSVNKCLLLFQLFYLFIRADKFKPAFTYWIWFLMDLEARVTNYVWFQPLYAQNCWTAFMSWAEENRPKRQEEAWMCAERWRIDLSESIREVIFVVTNNWIPPIHQQPPSGPLSCPGEEMKPF